MHKGCQHRRTHPELVYSWHLVRQRGQKKDLCVPVEPSRALWVFITLTLNETLKISAGLIFEE
jgi:hypothetical protein